MHYLSNEQKKIKLGVLISAALISIITFIWYFICFLSNLIASS